MKNSDIDFRLRQTKLWKVIFSSLQNDKRACFLIDSLSFVHKSLHLDDIQSKAVHDAYDHRIMFEATGMSIKGEETQNTKIVADVIVKYWLDVSSALPSILRDDILLESA